MVENSPTINNNEVKTTYENNNITPEKTSYSHKEYELKTNNIKNRSNSKANQDSYSDMKPEKNERVNQSIIKQYVPILPINNKRDRNLKVFLNTSMSFDHNNNLDERRNFSVDNKLYNGINQEKSPKKEKAQVKNLFDHKKSVNKKFKIVNDKKILKTNRMKKQNLNKSAEDYFLTNYNNAHTYSQKEKEENNYINDILIKKKVKKNVDMSKFMFNDLY